MYSMQRATCGIPVACNLREVRFLSCNPDHPQPCVPAASLVQPSLPPPAHLADAERALFQSAALSADEVNGGVLLSFVLPPPACDPQCTPAQLLRQRTLLDLLGFIGKVRSRRRNAMAHGGRRIASERLVRQ
jgi:hypothetical protein